MKKTIWSSIYIIAGCLVMMLAFQNCSKVGFTQDQSSLALKANSDGRVAGDDGAVPGKELPDDQNQVDDADWLYIPGGRGHVPMSSVAICPAGSKDAGKQECPMFCYKGVDYITTRDDARNYFAKKFAELPNYGGGAVPGTCANPDLKLKK